jgi:hypothetical protein
LAPWLRLAALLLLAAATMLVHLREQLLAWTAPQLVLARLPALPGRMPFRLGVTPFQLLARGLAALLSPPAVGYLRLGALLGLSILAVELVLRAVVPRIKQRNELQAARTLLRVRAMPASSGPGADVDLLRSLHALVPANPLAAMGGRAPWLALTLHGWPGEPIELGIALAAPNDRRIKRLVAAVRAAVAGHAPGAVVDIIEDPLTQEAATNSVIVWRAFRMLGPLDLPLRTLSDAEGDLLGPLLSALRPTSVRYTELQLVLRPLGSWALSSGWRAVGLRRLLRLQQRADYALSPDMRRLETRLAAPAFAAELRLVVLADGPGAKEQASAEVLVACLEACSLARSRAVCLAVCSTVCAGSGRCWGSWAG